ncbi:pentatricopeptide repeat-containing protein At1g64583, mitochondrial-like [Aristolochia californica]|uniref:pentatricopeptide repeat-containing protein At1g64583, mitochondrial-like n=1 Tax=Aristolochia californica TaxID=171875 RepID=UPI0035DE9CA3
MKQGLEISALNKVNILQSKCKYDNVQFRSGLGSMGSVKVNGGLYIEEQLNVHHFGGNIGRFRLQDDAKTFKLMKQNDILPVRREVVILVRAEKSLEFPNKAVVERSSEIPTEDMEIPNCVEESGTKVSMEKKNSLGLDITKSDGKLRSKQWFERVEKITSGGSVKIIDLFGDFPSSYDFNSLLYALVKARKLEAAISLFSELLSYGLSPTSWTLSTMILCYCQKNVPDEAKRILDLMVQSGFSPKVTTFTILINCFSRSGRLQKAFEIFDIMGRTKCKPSVQTYNCLISGLCYVGRVEEANDLLMKIKGSSIKPDIYTFTAVMDGLCKVGRSDEGMELLEEALKIGLKPSAITYNTLFDGYCREGRPLEGIKLLRVMEERNCQPDFISYCTLLRGLLKWKQISAGLQIYKKMSEAGFLLDEQIMNNLLRGICRKSLTDEELLSEALELLKQMKQIGSSLSPSTYNLMIHTLAIRGQTYKALDMLHEMVRLRYLASAVTLNCLIQALCNEGRVNEAWMVLMLMVQGRRRLADRNLYILLLDEFNRQGCGLDACKVLGFALKQGVNPYHRLEKKEF